MERREHWERVYRTKESDRVSWFQQRPMVSLALIDSIDPGRRASLIDVGAGASTLVDELLEQHRDRVAVLDVAEPALALVRERLGDRAAEVEWYVADVTTFDPPHRWDIWHDRAVFHFLVAPEDRDAYVSTLHRAVVPGGHAIIASFGPEGPERCSGLPVQRYDPATLAAALGAEWRLVASKAEDHRTPTGVSQSFVYCHLRRRR